MRSFGVFIVIGKILDEGHGLRAIRRNGETISLTRLGARGKSIGIERKAKAGTGHPPYPSGRIAYHESEGSHGVRNDTAGADEGIFTNLIATDNSDISTDRRTAAHHRRAIFTLAGDERAGINDVGEDSRWADEDIILEGHAIINRYIVLDLAAIANYGR